MNLPAWFGRSSPLQAALRRGLAKGGNLADELSELEDSAVKSRADARAICHTLKIVLDRTPAPAPSGRSPLYSLLGMFQDVESPDCPAFAVLRDEGTPVLAQLATRALEHGPLLPDDELLFVLKTLAMYGTREGADAVMAAARKPIQPEAYLWSVILGCFSEGHPHATRLFSALAAPLPPGFLAVALLDAANRFSISGGECRHPFDSAEGLERLSAWLANTRRDHASYAVSATAALPFLNHPRRGDLLAQAMRHPDRAVAIEAARTAAKLGDEAGIARLADACRDVNQSSQARDYLEELQRADAIPEAALEAGFQARAEFAQWLAHPNELGRAPDEVEIVDSREVSWPPGFERNSVWLLRFRALARNELEEDETGVGMVGTVTWCFFGYQLDQRPPEDAYALHCCWELETEHLKFLRVDDDATDYDSWLVQWPGPRLEAARVEHVVEAGPELRLPRRLLAVATARCNGAAGWAVLDGPDSRWYPAEEFPADERPELVLRIHVGRRLLNLPETGARNSWLKPKQSRPPHEIVAAYDRELARFETLPVDGAEEIERSWSLLGRHSGIHVEALGAADPEGCRLRTLDTFNRLLEAARRCASVLGEDAFDSLSAPGQHFGAAVDALAAQGRKQEVVGLVAFFTPHWQHNAGSGQLGTAAFKAGDFDTAQAFFLKLKAGLDDWHRCEEMGLLARIWMARGHADDARGLLLDCVEGVLDAGRKASASDRRLHEEWFQQQRRALLELFPDVAAELQRRGIPSFLLPDSR